MVENHARFAPFGFVTPEEFVVALRMVMAECQAQNQTLLLVDTRSLEHAPLTIADRYYMGDAAAGFWDRSILMSMVVRPDQRDPNHFGQIVALNRGLMFGLYTDEAVATAWLLSSPTAAELPP